MIVWLSLAPGAGQISAGLPAPGEHILAYGAAGAAFALAYPGRLAKCAAGLVAFGLALELLQMLVPGREAEWIDAIGSTWGALAGVALAGACTRSLGAFRRLVNNRTRWSRPT